MKRLVIAFIMLSAMKINAQQPDSAAGPVDLTAHLGVAYVPVGEIEFTNRDVKYDLYDNLAYRIALEYHFADLLSAGPAFEYLRKRINPDGTFDVDIVQYTFYIDFRINHALTDSGANYLVFGAGTGFSNLVEIDNETGNGFSLYGEIGIDISVYNDIGMDLTYRFQAGKVSVGDRNYQFNGSAIMAGLNYRLRL
jgi:hypothetical protein